MRSGYATGLAVGAGVVADRRVVHLVWVDVWGQLPVVWHVWLLVRLEDREPTAEH